jgi:uncharacterized membrane protein YfcA
MEWYMILAVILAGFVAGFINTLAGSGSTITLPLLIFLGLPANVANGTNRISIFFQTLVSVGSFKKQKVIEAKTSMRLAIPAVIGSIIGAQFAVEINERIMNNAIAIMLVIMFFLLLFKPEAWIKGQADLASEKPGIFQIVIFFVIGIYGGFIQAGVGMFLLAGLVLGSGLDLVKANAVKNLIILLFTSVVMVIFMYNNQINYEIGLILAAGSMLGAYVASKFAVSWGPKFIRYVLLFVILGASLKLFGLF